MNLLQIQALHKAAEFRAPAVEVYREELHKEIKIAARNQVREIREKIESYSDEAVDRMAKIMRSSNEQIAFQASKLLIEHTIGRPLSRTDNRTINVNIDVLAD